MPGKRMIAMALVMLLLLWSLGGGTAETAQTQKIYWPVEDDANGSLWYEMMGMPRRHIAIAEYDMRSGSLVSYDMPDGCHMIQSDDDVDGIVLARGHRAVQPVAAATANDPAVDILLWRNGGIAAELATGLTFPDYYRILAYRGGYVYYVKAVEPIRSYFDEYQMIRVNVNNPEDTFDYGLFDSGGDIAISADGNVVSHVRFKDQILSDTLMSYSPQGDHPIVLSSRHHEDWDEMEWDDDAHSDDQEQLFERIDSNYDQFEAPIWLDGHRLLFWGRLAHDGRIETKTLRKGEYEHGELECAQYDVPTHFVRRLLCYDASTGHYGAYPDQNGDPIELQDVHIWGNVYIDAKEGLLAFEAWPDNPLHYLGTEQDLFPRLTDGSNVTVVSLATGESTVAFGDAEKDVDYDKYWEYVLMQSDSHANGVVDEIVIPDDQLARYNALKSELYADFDEYDDAW